MTREARAVVGVDFLPAGDEAIRVALGRASEQPALKLHFVHALNPNDLPDEFGDSEFDTDEEVVARALELLRARIERVGRVHGLSVEPARTGVQALIGKPTAALIRACREQAAELLIVGTHARRGLGKLVLGSVAEALVRAAPCPVLVARRQREPERAARDGVRDPHGEG